MGISFGEYARVPAVSATEPDSSVVERTDLAREMVRDLEQFLSVGLASPGPSAKAWRRKALDERKARGVNAVDAHLNRE
jgi:hypothetical protein